MTSRRIAVFTAPRHVELRSDPERALAPGEALVRIRACGLCTMEQRLWTGAQSDYPIAAGHETAGIVEAVHPEQAIAAELGQRVAIAFLDRCLQCDACRRGDTHLCTGKLRDRRPGQLRRIGGLADYAIVPASKLFAMPDSLSFEEIALSEPLACVVHSVSQGCLRLGDDVLVIGFGTMGFLHLLVARQLGTRVFVIEPRADRRQIALQHGAHAALDPADPDRQLRWIAADVVFVTTGDNAAPAMAAEAVRPGGRIVYFANTPADVAAGVDPRRLHHEEVSLVGARGQTMSDWQQATRLLAKRLVDLRPLISARYSLEDLPEALEHASGGETFRVLVNPD